MSGVTSTREVARRIGLSETALRKAERAGRIAREHDGSWDVAKVRQGLAVKSPRRGGRPPKPPQTAPWARPPEWCARPDPEIGGAALSIHAELDAARQALERAARQMAALYPEILRLERTRDAAIAAQEAPTE